MLRVFACAGNELQSAAGKLRRNVIVYRPPLPLYERATRRSDVQRLELPFGPVQLHWLLCPRSRSGLSGRVAALYALRRHSLRRQLRLTSAVDQQQRDAAEDVREQRCTAYG